MLGAPCALLRFSKDCAVCAPEHRSCSGEVGNYSSYVLGERSTEDYLEGGAVLYQQPLVAAMGFFGGGRAVEQRRSISSALRRRRARVRPRTTCSDAVATNELGSAVALTRDNAVPDQLRWQVCFFSHFNPLCCEGEAVPWGRNSKALMILKYLFALIPIALIALLGGAVKRAKRPTTKVGRPASPRVR
jgi:hypothetical protein